MPREPNPGTWMALRASGPTRKFSGLKILDRQGGRPGENTPSRRQLRPCSDLPRVSLPLNHTPRVFPILPLPLPHLIAVFEPKQPFRLSREATQPDLCSPQRS